MRDLINTYEDSAENDDVISAFLTRLTKDNLAPVDDSDVNNWVEQKFTPFGLELQKAAKEGSEQAKALMSKLQNNKVSPAVAQFFAELNKWDQRDDETGYEYLKRCAQMAKTEKRGYTNTIRALENLKV